MQRDVDAVMDTLEIFDETLDMSRISRRDHVADFQPAHFAARRLARGLLGFIGPMQNAARALQKPRAGLGKLQLFIFVLRFQ